MGIVYKFDNPKKVKSSFNKEQSAMYQQAANSGLESNMAHVNSGFTEEQAAMFQKASAVAMKSGLSKEDLKMYQKALIEDMKEANKMSKSSLTKGIGEGAQEYLKSLSTDIASQLLQKKINPGFSRESSSEYSEAVINAIKNSQKDSGYISREAAEMYQKASIDAMKKSLQKRK